MPVLAVIPGFDAESTIADVVRGVRAAGLETVLVVDDGSDDGTAAAAEAAGARVLRHARNRGKGAALWTGFRAAGRLGASAVLTLDADGQHDPADLPRLLAAHRERPLALVLGVRALAAGVMPGRSRLGNRISTFFLRTFSREPLTDSQSGFRLYPAALFDRVTPRARRFDAETELLLEAVALGHPVVEVPVKTIYRAQGATHFRNLSDTGRIILVVLRWLCRNRLGFLPRSRALRS